MAKASKTGTAVESWGAALSRAAEQQKQGMASLGGSSAWISFRGGQLTVDGAAIPGGAADAVVFSFMEERAYYEEDFDPDSSSFPVCYAYGSVNGGATVAPHAESKAPQADKCKGCAHAEWGSADRGRGQACKQSVRLALVPLSSKATPADFEKEPMYFGRIPPTSIKNVKGWLAQFAAEEIPTFGGVTSISVAPDAKTQFQVKLRKTADIPAALRPAVLARVAEANREIEQPYPSFEDESKPAAKAKAKVGKRKF